MPFSEKRVFGNLGEDLACKHLSSKGYVVSERNYLKKAGEIDIVALKDGTIHFVEVKTMHSPAPGLSNNVDQFRPEDNVHPKKLDRLARTVELYLQERGVSSQTPWQIDLLAVLIDTKEKKARVRFLENVNAW